MFNDDGLSDVMARSATEERIAQLEGRLFQLQRVMAISIGSLTGLVPLRMGSPEAHELEAFLRAHDPYFQHDRRNG